MTEHCCWMCTESELFGELDESHKVWAQVPQSIHGELRICPNVFVPRFTVLLNNVHP